MVDCVGSPSEALQTCVRVYIVSGSLKYLLAM